MTGKVLVIEPAAKLSQSLGFIITCWLTGLQIFEQPVSTVFNQVWHLD